MTREKKIIIRLKRSEYEQLADLALRQGKNVSSYIRTCIFERKKIPASIERELKNLNQQIRKVRVTIENTEKKITQDKGISLKSPTTEKESFSKDYTEEITEMLRSVVQMQKLVSHFDDVLKNPDGYYED